MRCFGNKPGQQFYADYHDFEWGQPVHDDQKLFELLILEGAQAGLSWETILKRRDAYRKVFHAFDPKRVAQMSDAALNALLQADSPIIRNRLKVFSARKNAQAFLKIQAEYGSFAAFLWGFVDDKPIDQRPARWEDVPAQTPLSQQLSKTLKKYGMSFVGPTIMYAFMQAVGMVNDHLLDCDARTAALPS